MSRQFSKAFDIFVGFYAFLLLGLAGGRWVEFLYYLIAKEKSTDFGITLCRILSLSITTLLVWASGAVSPYLMWIMFSIFLILLLINEKNRKNRNGSIGDLFMMMHILFLATSPIIKLVFKIPVL